MKKIILLPILLLTILCYLQAQKDDPQLQALWGQAIQEMPPRGDVEKAITILKEVADYAQKIDDDVSWASANVYVSYLYMHTYDMKHWRQFAELVENKIPELNLAGNNAIAINADYRFLLGKYYYEKGWYEQAGGYFQEAIDLLLASAQKDAHGRINYAGTQWKFSMNPGDLFNDAALVYDKFGDYDKAAQYYDIAIKLSPPGRGNARKMSNMGLAYLNLGELNKALPLLHQAKGYYTPPKTDYERETLGLIHKNLANYHLFKGQLDSCELNIERSLELNKKEEFRVKAYHVYLNSLKGNPDETKINTVFDSILLIADRIGYFHPDIAKGYRIRGDIFDHKDEFKPADTHYNTAINILRGTKSSDCECKEVSVASLNDKRQALEIISRKAKNLSQNNLLDKSLDCYTLLNQLILELHEKYIISEESKYFLAQKAKTYYEDAITACIAAQKTGEGYQYSQSSRGMVLLQQIQDKNAMQATALPDEVRDYGQQIKRKINEYQKEREEALQANDQAALGKWDEALFSQNKRYEDWIAQLEKEYPEYYALKHKLPKISLNDLRKQARRRDATLVEYFIGDRELYTFVLNGDKVEVDVQPLDKAFFANIEAVIRNVKKLDYSWESFDEYSRAAHELYQVLLGRIVGKGWVKNKHLIIVPDGQLTLLPFDALLTEARKTTDNEVKYSQLAYLLNQYDISYLYSSHLMAQHSRSANKHFLGVAPAFENPSIPALENNQEEVNSINGFYKGLVITGREATHARFMEIIGDYNIAHFATHAIFNDEIPLDSRIELADTSLYIYEIFSLSHQLQLTVLSACQTASGKQRKGEGVVSLSRSFIQSGCPSVVASLWDVSDQKASDLMTNFHKLLIQDNQRKDEALATAKREYLSNALNVGTHPFLWAGFIQIGDSSPIASAGGNNYLLLGLIALAAIAFIFALFRKFKSNAT